ncbi:protein FAR1-RELATED SEQUENCE 5-like [Aegilops tauschii subsp. strangulata]|uniref:protein FAR1-RELATED SEQUENCE 5-like n=1 Tax=Aegilops tauschii subsp. strangulata TaxID=200361 RepID=UPI00098AA23D
MYLPSTSYTGPSTTINSRAGTSTAGSSERTEDAFHQPANTHATKNAESVSEMAIVPAIPTSTHVHTSTSNTQADETAADTEVNDETGDEAQGDEDGGQSEIMVSQPPYLGQRFDSFADAKEFYQTYAKFHGFAVNTEYHRKIKKTNEYSRGEMRCYKARRNKKGKGDAPVVPERKRGIIVKTECPVRCKLNVDGAQWVVTEYFDEHNHELIKKFDLVKFLTAHRGFTPLEKKFIKLLHDCNVGPSRMVQILSLIHSKNGSLSSMPYLPADVTNLKAKYRRESKLADIEATIAYFDEKAKEDQNFFYRIRLDDEDRVRNMYWVDGAARRAYKHFRDCISFDATYLTNMYKMPCAPFIGINNHNQSLKFGCGLVRNEDTDGYVWLFKTFLECMGGLAPMNIITDQDFSMSAGIEVFSLAVHRHCRWHIIKKAEETLGPFFADRPDLHKAFELCVDHSLTVEEFERSWMAMIETYQVQDHETLASLWEKRMYWVPAYFMQCFFPFLQTTQRIEGFNAILKRYVSPGNSLLQFAKQYTALQQKILGSELQQEANTALKQPKLLTYLPMGRQMSKIYTNMIFNKFQEEIKRASMYTAFQVGEHTFKVCSIMGMSDSEPEDPDKGRNYFVKASISEGEYYCQCCKFERDGIVCYHILKVMDLNAVTRMPCHFIRRRWTWDADDALVPQTSNAVLAVHDERPESTMEAVRHVVLTKYYAELIDEACKSDETARVAEKHRKALKRELDEIKKRKAEEALHRFLRTSSVPSSTGPSPENSEVGSGIASTQTQVHQNLK